MSDQGHSFAQMAPQKVCDVVGSAFVTRTLAKRGSQRAARAAFVFAGPPVASQDATRALLSRAPLNGRAQGPDTPKTAPSCDAWRVEIAPEGRDIDVLEKIDAAHPKPASRQTSREGPLSRASNFSAGPETAISVFIIDEVHRSHPSFNALLKSIEGARPAARPPRCSWNGRRRN